MAQPESKPAAVEAAEPKLTPEEAAAQAAASKAKAELKLIKVTSTRKQRIDSPNAGWSLAEGANAFEGEIPKAVAEVYAQLVKDKVITVQLIDGEGKSTDWTPSAPATEQPAKP
jgi:hypothetical protein